uniref:G-protein coupled receptors family 1 profile domain-containing protein n=1 Tax=Leptobrachium leishanense TaxID=445787 RepID=A0A8C5P6X6_9ANUR
PNHSHTPLCRRSTLCTSVLAVLRSRKNVFVCRLRCPAELSCGRTSDIGRHLLLLRSYMMAMCVADNLVLIQIVILEMILQYYTTEPFWCTSPWCMIRDVLNYGAYNSSVWLVVCFTIERFVAIKTQQLKTKMCTRKCSLYTIASVFICSHLFSIQYFWSNESVRLNETNTFVCVYNSKLPHFYVETMVWVQTTLIYMIPYIIIFTLNGFILNRKSFSSLAGIKKQKLKSVVLLVTVSMTFAFFCTTRFVTQILIKTMHYEINRKDYNKSMNIAADIGTMLDLTSTAINMYLYACTQYRFRKELLVVAKSVVRPCKMKKRKEKNAIFSICSRKSPAFRWCLNMAVRILAVFSASTV